MTIISTITNIDRKFGWSFFGVVLAVIFGLLSLYTGFWKETSPQLQFEVLSNEPVLDVREKLPDLEVLYQSQDIASAGKTLSVLLVRGINRGSANLLSTFYDAKAPVQLEVVGGTLIRAELTSTSNDYLKETAAAKTAAPLITLSPVILEPNEWFIVKILVLHKLDEKTRVIAKGKVAGQKLIPVVANGPVNASESFWSSIFSGGILVQIFRLFSYFFGTVIILTAILVPTFSLLDKMSKNKRKKLVKHFKEKTKLSLSDSDEWIFKGFVSEGLKFVLRATNTVADQELLQKRVARHLEEKEFIKSDRNLKTLEVTSVGFIDEPSVYLPYLKFINIDSMIRNGFIKKLDDQWEPVAERLQVATSFIEFIDFVDASNA